MLLRGGELVASFQGPTWKNQGKRFGYTNSPFACRVSHDEIRKLLQVEIMLEDFLLFSNLKRVCTGQVATTTISYCLVCSLCAVHVVLHKHHRQHLGLN